MSLSERMQRVINEAKMYRNISGIIKLSNIPKNMEELGLESVVQHLYQRKLIMDELVNLGSNLYFLKEDEAAKLEEKLLQNDQFFLNLGDEKIAEIEKFFEKQPESIGKSNVWQSYHMAITSLSDLSVIRKAEDENIKYSEMSANAKEFKKVNKETKDFISKFESEHPGVKVAKLKQNIEEKKKACAESKQYEYAADLQYAKDELKAFNDAYDKFKKSADAYQHDLNRQKRITASFEKALVQLENNKDAIDEIWREYQKLWEKQSQINKEIEDLYKFKNEYDSTAVDRATEEYLACDEKYNDVNFKEYMDYQRKYQMLSDIVKNLENEKDESNLTKYQFGINDSEELRNKLSFDKAVETGLLYYRKSAGGARFLLDKDSLEGNHYNVIRREILSAFKEVKVNHEAKLQELREKIPQELQKVEKEAFEKWQAEVNALSNADKRIDELHAATDIDKKMEVLSKENTKKMLEIFKDADEIVKNSLDGTYENVKAKLKARIKEYKGYEDIHKQRLDHAISSRDSHMKSVEKWKKEYEARKSIYEKEKAAFDKNEAELKELEAVAENEELKNHMRAYNEAHKKTFGSGDVKVPQPTEKEMIAHFKNQAIKFLEKQNMYASKHANSKEFDAMMNVFRRLSEIDLNSPELNLEYNEITTDLVEKATKYKEEKLKQRRPFPSALRVARLNMADMFIDMGEKMVNAHADAVNRPDLADMNRFYVSNKAKTKEVKKTDTNVVINEGMSKLDVLKDAKALVKDPELLKFIKGAEEFYATVYEDDFGDTPYSELPDEIRNLMPLDYMVNELKLGSKEELNNKGACDLADLVDSMYRGDVLREAKKLEVLQKKEAILEDEELEADMEL